MQCPALGEVEMGRSEFQFEASPESETLSQEQIKKCQHLPCMPSACSSMFGVSGLVGLSISRLDKKARPSAPEHTLHRNCLSETPIWTEILWKRIGTTTDKGPALILYKLVLKVYVNLFIAAESSTVHILFIGFGVRYANSSKCHS